MYDLWNGYAIRNTLTEVVALVKLYAVSVCKKENKETVSGVLEEAFRAVGKIGNRCAKGKCQPTVEAMFMSWVWHHLQNGTIKPIVSDDRWAMAEDEVTAFIASITPVLTRLADGSRMKQAQAWRNDMHNGMTELSAKMRHGKVSPHMRN